MAPLVLCAISSRRSTLGGLAGATALALAVLTGACHRVDSSDAEDENRGATSGTGGAGGAGAGLGGTSGAAASAGMDGSAAGAAACTGSRTELTIDGTRWIEGACNDYEIEGRWYCFTDDIADNDCDKEVGPRYDKKLVGYCLSGTTILDSAFKAWGAALAFELNGDPVAGKSAYDAKAHGIVGFAVTMQGITSGNPLRLGFGGASNGTGVAPFVELPPLDNETRTVTALFDEASVPPGFPNTGEVADPSAIGDVELQVVGNLREAPFEYCITQVVPILTGAK